MQRLDVSGAVRPIYESLGVKRLKKKLQFSVDLSWSLEENSENLLYCCKLTQFMWLWVTAVNCAWCLIEHCCALRTLLSHNVA